MNDIAHVERVFANTVANWVNNNEHILSEIDRAIIHSAKCGEIETTVGVYFMNKHIVAHLYRTKGFNVSVSDDLCRTTRITISGWAK